MQRFTTVALWLVALLTAPAIGGGPSRADDVLDAAKHRQMEMDHLGDDLKSIKLFLQGQADHSVAVAAAKDIQSIAVIVPSLFPKGTDSAALPGQSAAKPDIWDNPDDFQQLEDALTSQAASLDKAVASGDQSAVADSLRSLVKNACGACHETYRGHKDGG